MAEDSIEFQRLPPIPVGPATQWNSYMWQCAVCVLWDDLCLPTACRDETFAMSVFLCLQYITEDKQFDLANQCYSHWFFYNRLVIWNVIAQKMGEHGQYSDNRITVQDAADTLECDKKKVEDAIGYMSMRITKRTFRTDNPHALLWALLEQPSPSLYIPRYVFSLLNPEFKRATTKLAWCFISVFLVRLDLLSLDWKESIIPACFKLALFLRAKGSLPDNDDLAHFTKNQQFFVVFLLCTICIRPESCTNCSHHFAIDTASQTLTPKPEAIINSRPTPPGEVLTPPIPPCPDYEIFYS